MEYSLCGVLEVETPRLELTSETKCAGSRLSKKQEARERASFRGDGTKVECLQDVLLSSVLDSAYILQRY